MNIESFHEPESGTWTHLLADTQAGQAAIIDPVWVYDSVSGAVSREFIDTVVQKATELGCAIQWVLETHAHADHLSAGDLLRKELGARIAIGRGICNVQTNFRKIFQMQSLATDGSQFDRLLSEGDTLMVGNIEIRVMETPGHTDDSVTYLAGGAAFIGDTLFAPGFGTARCDFPGGDAGKLYDTIRRIYDLPGDTRLYLCHDYPSEGNAPLAFMTVDQSKAENIHVRADTEKAEYVEMRSTRDAQLKLPKLIYPSVQVNVAAGAAPPAEAGGHSYLKIPFNATIADLLGADD